MSIGKLLLRGNYQFMISDPYAQAEFALGLTPKGLLNLREYYSKFWNDQKVQKVCASRSPLTDYSEHQVLNFKQNEKTDYWYRHLYSGVIYPIGGLDTLVHAGHDYDGDKIFTTDNQTIMNAIKKDINEKGQAEEIVPTCHEPQKAPKTYLILDGKFNYKALCEADFKTFGNDIGAIANFGTSLYALLARYSKDKHPREYRELRRRLTALYRESSNSIDKGKGIEVTPFPKAWRTIQKIKPTDSKEIKRLKRFQNKLAIVNSKKPLFMVLIYPQVMKKYNQYITSQRDQCLFEFNQTYKTLLQQNYKTPAQYKFLAKMKKYAPVYLDECNINRIYNYIQGLCLYRFKDMREVDILNVLEYENVLPTHCKKFLRFKRIYRQYISRKREFKKGMMQEVQLSSTDFTKLFYAQTRHEIEKLGLDNETLLEWAVKLGYGKKLNKDFLWEVCGDLLVERLEKIVPIRKRLEIIPSDTPDNSIEYLGKYYYVRSNKTESN